MSKSRKVSCVVIFKLELKIKYMETPQCIAPPISSTYKRNDIQTATVKAAVQFSITAIDSRERLASEPSGWRQSIGTCCSEVTDAAYWLSLLHLHSFLRDWINWTLSCTPLHSETQLAFKESSGQQFGLSCTSIHVYTYCLQINSSNNSTGFL